MDLSIIIPCYNEEGNIKECIQRIPKIPYNSEAIIVDDGSRDLTTKIAKETSNNHLKRIKVISYKKNRGKGYAFRTGLKYSTGQVIIILDADMTSPPEDIPTIIEPIFKNKADFVNGTRMILPMEVGAMSLLHKMGNKIFAFLLSTIIKTPLTDSLCGFKAYNKRFLPYYLLKEDSWMDFELLIKASRNNLRIAEVPISYRSRKAGNSKMKTFKHGYNMLVMLIKALKEK